MVNTYAKGYRNERRAMQYLEEEGYKCWRAKLTRHGKNDFFGLFDLVCIHSDKPTLWVQVKSNKINRQERDRIYKNFMGDFDCTHNIAIIMIWIDYQGWEIFRTPPYLGSGAWYNGLP